MNQCVRDYVGRLNHNSSLRPLYQRCHLRVLLKGKRSECILCFDKDGCRIEENKDVIADVIVSGRDKDLKRILTGKERLMMKQAEANFTVKGRYRHLLKLESLFYLNGVERYLYYQQA